MILIAPLRKKVTFILKLIVGLNTKYKTCFPIAMIEKSNKNSMSSFAVFIIDKSDIKMLLYLLLELLIYIILVALG